MFTLTHAFRGWGPVHIVTGIQRASSMDMLTLIHVLIGLRSHIVLVLRELGAVHIDTLLRGLGAVHIDTCSQKTCNG